MWDGVTAALALSPVVFVAVRAAALARLPEPDPRVMLDLERSELPGQMVVALFGTALLATATTALASRRSVSTERLLAACFAAGVLASLGAAVLR